MSDSNDTPAYAIAEEQLERQLTTGERLGCTSLALGQWTVSELSDASGVHTVQAHRYSKALEAAGLVEIVNEYPAAYQLR